MDVRRSINTRIWSDEWFETLCQKEKLLWVYLLTNSHTNMLGVYEISLKKISFETGLTNKDILKAFEGFERLSKAFYHGKKTVVLVNWIKNQSMNDNMIVSAERLYESLPESLKTILLGNGFKGFESLSNPSEKGKGNRKGKGSGKIKDFSPSAFNKDTGLKPGMVL